jgi:universal stress protein A
MEGSHSIALKANVLADKFSAKLSIVHVIELLPTTHYMQSLSCTDTLDIHMQSVKSILSNLGDEFDIPLERQYVKEGNAAKMTVLLANTLDIDTIIIGSYTNDPLKNVFGSTASAILHKARCNIYTMKTGLTGEIAHE